MGGAERWSRATGKERVGRRDKERQGRVEGSGKAEWIGRQSEADRSGEAEGPEEGGQAPPPLCLNTPAHLRTDQRPVGTPPPVPPTAPPSAPRLPLSAN